MCIDVLSDARVIRSALAFLVYTSEPLFPAR